MAALLGGGKLGKLLGKPAEPENPPSHAASQKFSWSRKRAAKPGDLLGDVEGYTQYLEETAKRENPAPQEPESAWLVEVPEDVQEATKLAPDAAQAILDAYREVVIQRCGV